MGTAYFQGTSGTSGIMSQQDENVLFGQSRNVLLTGSSLERGRRTTADDPGRARPASSLEEGQEETDHPKAGSLDFWFSAERDAAAAKQFFQKALQAPGHPRPRVITVDGNPSYPKVIAELKQERKLGRRCRCRTCPYLNNVVEQDHRGIKRRVNASQGF
jgi:hypothetical protein